VRGVVLVEFKSSERFERIASVVFFAVF
jgi:hypothetical protein